MTTFRPRFAGMAAGTRSQETFDARVVTEQQRLVEPDRSRRARPVSARMSGPLLVSGQHERRPVRVLAVVAIDVGAVFDRQVEHVLSIRFRWPCAASAGRHPRSGFGPTAFTSSGVAARRPARPAVHHCPPRAGTRVTALVDRAIGLSACSRVDLRLQRAPARETVFARKPPAAHRRDGRREIAVRAVRDSDCLAVLRSHVEIGTRRESLSHDIPSFPCSPMSANRAERRRVVSRRRRVQPFSRTEGRLNDRSRLYAGSAASVNASAD